MIIVRNTKKKAQYMLCLLYLLLISCNTSREKPIALTKEQTCLKKLEDTYKNDLHACIAYLDSMRIPEQNSQSLMANYLKSKKYFKRVTPILAATDKASYSSLNAPNILKVEEEDATDIKIKMPFGFQVIEELLHEVPMDTLQLQKTIKNTRNRLRFLLDNTQLNLKKRHVLWLLRDAIIRIATTGITGFDSPVLENALEDAQTVYKRLEELLITYQPLFDDKAHYNTWLQYFRETQETLTGNFDSFDRYTFIKNHTHPQLVLWVATVKDWKVSYAFEMAIRNDATTLFSDATFNLNYFSDYHDDSYNASKIKLGAMLFNDKNLSTAKTISCASCHQKEKAFTDGKTTFPKQFRNTPTLSYAVFQKGFFYDKRSGSLEGQIVSVMNNKNEFHATPTDLVNAVRANTTYTTAFNSIYDGNITDANIRNAIASYVRSLAPFNSKFDRNINGMEQSLTQNEIHGFNLFMGKAKCATCHFPPTFNGTVPPNFKESEMELIGVPEKADGRPIVDDDLGRYYVFETQERKHFFKTPTVRNISKTAPYMHNGVYGTLEEVMDFYNHGGGAGMGMDLPLQTLPSDSLHLSKQEIRDIIAFMKTLNDHDTPDL